MPTAKTDEIKVRVSPEVKSRAQAVLDHWDMSMSQAIGLFLIKLADEGGIPFPVAMGPRQQAALWAASHEWRDEGEREEHEWAYARLVSGGEPLGGPALEQAAVSHLDALGA